MPDIPQEPSGDPDRLAVSRQDTRRTGASDKLEEAPMMQRRLQLVSTLGGLALLATACTGTEDTTDTSGTTSGQAAQVAEPTAPSAVSSTEATTDATGGGTNPFGGGGSSGELGTATGQQGAEDIEIDFTSPDDGVHLEEEPLSVTVRLDDVRLSPEFVGTENRANTGHWHLYLDDSLVDMVTDTTYELSLVNVDPGEHTLRAVPALNDHTELTDPAQGDEVTFDWDPDVPPNDIVATNFDGEPELDIVSPSDGTVVGRNSWFDLKLDVDNFRLSRELFGKEDLEGYGHWHLNLEGDGGDQLGGLIAMGATDNVRVPTHGLDPGVHTFVVTLTGNSHAPLQGDIQDTVEITVE
jgi:hypothetical protein